MQENFLGTIHFERKSFDVIDNTIQEFKSSQFMSLSPYARQLKVNAKLLDLIRASGSTFVLRELVDYIQRVFEEGIVDKYNFSVFELWLNQFSNLSPEENYQIRCKIVGKYIPRGEYQDIFPIGMDKVYDGTHFVTAHGSPDLDTIVASFWGFIDAFAARVSSGLHVWNVPGGAPSAIVELKMLFYETFGPNVFKAMSRSRLSLTLSSSDLLTQKGLVKKKPKDLIFDFAHQRLQSAVVIVDDDDRYIGDWRSIDVEGVRQVINLFNTHLRFLEYFFQINLITLFAKKELKRDDLLEAITKIYQYQFKTFEPSGDLTQAQYEYLNNYMSQVLHIEKGINSTFDDLIHSMEKLGVSNFSDFHASIRELYLEDLFNGDGHLIEDRPLIFSRLEKVVTSLSVALRKVRAYVDSLGVAFKIKERVLGYRPNFLGYRSDIIEIQGKMQAYSYLTVNYVGSGGEKHPLGVIYANDLQKPILGTVSLRDFSNTDETHIPHYLEVISAIDHHKTSLTNGTPSKMIIADVQSVNVLVAQMSMAINDRYSFGGMTLDKVNAQLHELNEHEDTPLTLRLKQRLLMRKKNMILNKTSRIDSDRELMEYMHFIYAIFDDTDLLTKVSKPDVFCVASLLNRMKSLSIQREVESVHFDDIDENASDYVSCCAKRLLQNEELYSLYSKVYQEREMLISQHLKECFTLGQTPIFEDTKIQNGCARVGQRKVFAKNIPLLRQHAAEILNAWVKESIEAAHDMPEIDLHLLMISTIASAEDLFKGAKIEYEHKDELWIYIPPTDVAEQHLKVFLSGFSRSTHLPEEGLEVEFLGKNGKELAMIFQESFIPCSFVFNEYDIPIAIIHYKAGSINSRKSMISPYLPKLNDSI
ncbi:MAG: hypothetical protein K9M07_00010 [Simkaniaceae bacterium]|nr:hypothetical protein [Simkaniaceae bacterium]